MQNVQSGGSPGPGLKTTDLWRQQDSEEWKVFKLFALQINVYHCVLLCVCSVSCKVYCCELMLDSKRYGMRDNL